MSSVLPHSQFSTALGYLARRVAPCMVAWVACGQSIPPGNDAGTAAASDVERASVLLSDSAAWPTRPEVVALADAISVAAAKEASLEEQARLYRVAADLRVKSFRFDRAEADAREAAELYQAVTRAARGKEAACEADRVRARLAGEFARDAAISQRELYLARRRNAELGAGKASDCLQAIDRELSLSIAYRPSGAELAALERDGDRAEQTARREPADVAGGASAAASPATPRDIVVAPAALAPSKEPVKVTKIEKYGAEGGGRVVVFVSGPTSFQVGSLVAEAGKDPRIYVDIDRASVKGVPRDIEVGGGIKRVRTAPREGGSRIVLDLAADLHKKVFYLPEPFRIVIDVSSRNPEAAPSGAASGPRKIKRVAIDPGHGGTDAGAVGPTGLKEKEVTLAIAHLVAPVLASELGIETLLTRDSDTFVALDERTARANAFHADLFVSIHCNASETGEARGIEVFILDELKDTSRATARIAAMENGLGKSLDAGAIDAEMASIAQRLGSGEIAASSRKLGVLLGKATLASLSERYPNTTDHGLKSAGFYVLAGAEMPAVLFETSFISNPDDESRLAKADYKQKLADGIVNAIKAYRDGK